LTVYYLGRTARITDQVFESRWPIQRRFVVSELRCPHTFHDSAIRVVAASTQVRVCSGGAFGLSAFATVTGWPVFDVPGMTAAGFLAAVIAGLAVRAARRSRRQPLEVRALYRGELVCLYITTNRYTLGQVRRALLRALEHQADAR
jgi:hypothetical protein